MSGCGCNQAGGALVGVAPVTAAGLTYGAVPSAVVGAAGWAPGGIEMFDAGQPLPVIPILARPAFPWWVALLVVGAVLALGGRKA